MFQIFTEETEMFKGIFKYIFSISFNIYFQILICILESLDCYHPPETQYHSSWHMRFYTQITGFKYFLLFISCMI